jgi:hypothetical protein
LEKQSDSIVKDDLIPALGAPGLSHQPATLVGLLAQAIDGFMGFVQKFNPFAFRVFQSKRDLELFFLVIEAKEFSPVSFTRFQDRAPFVDTTLYIATLLLHGELNCIFCIGKPEENFRPQALSPLFF